MSVSGEKVTKVPILSESPTFLTEYKGLPLSYSCSHSTPSL